MPHLARDILFYFRSNCCQSLDTVVDRHRYPPCGTYARSTPSQSAIEKCFRRQREKEIELNIETDIHFATITFAPYYNRFSATKLRELVIETLDRTITEQETFWCVFEFNKNGNLHAHMLITGMFRRKFVETFQKFGEMNEKEISFLQVEDLEKKIKYMKKDIKSMDSWPPVTNIQNPVAYVDAPQARYI